MQSDEGQPDTTDVGKIKTPLSIQAAMVVGFRNFPW